MRRFVGDVDDVDSKVGLEAEVKKLWDSIFFLYLFSRPGRTGLGSSGRGVLSMSALSYGVVRVDQENSLTSLTLQDAGQVLPGGNGVLRKKIYLLLLKFFFHFSDGRRC